ncbi:MICOS complex subunit mic25a isoform X2 [Lepisosteus oculatus]|uniref:MICOS complex subunit mic25a isoform X2 n=1 Tax=Lepisosteus oculatus TaxID=7918 RepID=UPI00073FB63E|nr:PREDICTED: MICOS complex subunit MIC25 isoform X2 [Lepisosteus oculatus]
MGGSESVTRKVSFGLDEEDRVRVLHGIKLSEDVIRKMKEKSAESKPSASDEWSSSQTESSKDSSGSKMHSGHTVTVKEEELYRRYEREKAMVQEELARIARKERESVRDELSLAVLRERAHTRQEAEKAKVLAKQLERKEAELKLLDTFYKEQLAHLEKKNIEYYKLTSEQFHEAAAQAEAHVKKRRVEPLCSNLQSEILRCYRENKEQTLNCSDLAKEYMQCINAAKKEPAGESWMKRSYFDLGDHCHGHSFDLNGNCQLK